MPYYKHLVKSFLHKMYCAGLQKIQFHIYIVYMSWSRICFMSICNKRVCSINLCCYNCWSSIGLITTLWKTTWDIYWIKVSSSSSVDSLTSHLLVQEEQIYIGHTFEFNSSMIWFIENECKRNSTVYWLLGRNNSIFFTHKN